MTTPAAVLTRFYEAFARRDAAAMAACYHPEATFEDPAFGHLDREGVCAMWAMVLGRATDLTVTHRVETATVDEGTVHWEARYTFTRTGRPVVNRISARFTFRDGLILTHRDHFSFWTWSRQAFGITGLLVGWTPLFQRQVRAEALRGLEAFRART
jgi:ketosteroid isomerase-like protein